jgi:hypothetical protein
MDECFVLCRLSRHLISGSLEGPGNKLEMAGARVSMIYAPRQGRAGQVFMSSEAFSQGLSSACDKQRGSRFVCTYSGRL